MAKFKILYIPTNNFLMDHNNDGVTVMLFDTIAHPNILEDILRVNDQEFVHWRKHNNIVLPLLAEELEIMYD